MVAPHFRYEDSPTWRQEVSKLKKQIRKLKKRVRELEAQRHLIPDNYLDTDDDGRDVRYRRAGNGC